MIDLDFLLRRILLRRFRLSGFFRCNGFPERRRVLLDLAEVAAGRAALIRDFGAVNHDLLDDEFVRQGRLQINVDLGIGEFECALCVKPLGVADHQSFEPSSPGKR